MDTTTTNNNQVGETNANETTNETKTETKKTKTKKTKRGFAAMDRERVKEYAQRGGKAAWANGTAYRYQKGSALASEAGRKGGLACGRNRRAKQQAA